MRRARCLAFFLIVAQHPLIVWGEDAPDKSSRELLKDRCYYLSYPNGMLFHTAFHWSFTTRYLLLKSAPACPAFKQYLELDADQVERIAELRPLHHTMVVQPDSRDANAQPDELVVDPDYYGFLRDDQLLRLDATALRFDGFAALTRKSLADHVELSEDTRTKIAEAVVDLRKRVFLPRSRWEFAAPLPDDIKYRNCQFAGAFVTQVNYRIVDLMTDDECQRVLQLMKSVIDEKVLDEIEKKATLPDGVWSLHKGLKNAEIWYFPEGGDDSR